MLQISANKDLLLRFQYSNTHTHGLQRSCGGKGTVRPLSQEESASDHLGHSLKGEPPTLALTSLYRFFRPLTSKKVLFYYAKVCFGWLSLQTQERVSLNTSKEDICNVKGQNGRNGLCPIPGGSSPDSVKIKILSKHLLSQFRVREFHQEQVS